MDHHGKVWGLTQHTTPESAFERIKQIYDCNSEIIRQTFENFVINKAEKKDLDPSATLYTTYPYLGIRITPESTHDDASYAFGSISETGVYGSTLTRPDLFEDYYKEQIGILLKRHKVPVVVGSSNCRIPLPFIENIPSEAVEHKQLSMLRHEFALPNLREINDEIANSFSSSATKQVQPLSLFSAERVDFSLQRLQHYSGTAAKHFQHFILLTNYQRYVDGFVEFAREQLKKNNGYTRLVEPGNVITTYDGSKFKTTGTPRKHLPQMPTYHLERDDKEGITFINIGVGPSNAKTITDHLAVLRPHCWIMVGHCAGLRRTQFLGDYVLAHGYVRDDHVLDDDLPPWIPVPPIAEVQVALQDAVARITGLKGMDLKSRMRTGTVITVDNRNWELRTAELLKYLKQSRSIALDMESATVAANGFRFRVPYGTLLCVSDKPIHGELKLPGMANSFYQERVQQHLRIGLETIRLMREAGSVKLHSRKLRGFEEPPFR
ncbi:MAG: AMP nucleosidase [Alphaproteobacteria bacterium]|jgi:AMP nucleosidase|nr:AMP nucleosidase [Alphaproteobacteria bacterium]MBT5389676.1 AMP nucleosidase [Alphaproteobacteria bacterium]MBT5540195.1 AMP nucleosidase [Alphaproteobacteria bacterium]MBT5653973.1 AMP nucleosidase [Alphaproteobacteria bacterium]